MSNNNKKMNESEKKLEDRVIKVCEIIQARYLFYERCRSHNLYTPCLLGAVVLTDQLACPSHLDDPLYPIIQFDSPRTLVDFCNFQTCHLKIL